jgi:nucleoid-associated protein YejK
MTNQKLLADYTQVYDGKFATIYDMSHEIPFTAFAYWKGFFRLSDPDFVKDMHHSTEYIHQERLKVFISDHSMLQVVTEDVLAWLHQNWYAKASQYGLLVEASLDANNVFGQLSLQKMLDEAKTGKIITPKFPDFVTAKKYVKEFLEAQANA